MNTVIRRLEDGGLFLGGLFVILVMLIVTVDAVARYAFRAPLPWAFEVISYYLLVGAAYLPISSTFRHGDHINLNLLRQLFPQWLRKWLDLLWGGLSLALFALIAYLAFEVSLEAYSNKEYNPGYVAWPVWLSFLPIPVGAGFLTLRLAHHCLILMAEGRDPHVDLDAEHDGVAE